MNSGARILAIEDDVLLASHLQQHLSQCGFAVTLQHDGALGLAQACNEEFDLVLLDVLLPGRRRQWRALKLEAAVPPPPPAAA